MRRAWLTYSVAFVFAFTSACSGTDGSKGPIEKSPDSKNADVVTSGKGDLPWSDCEIQHAVLLLNDASTDLQTLKDKGVHTRGARNLIEYRNGEDGDYLTDDDQYFDDIEEVDDVYWVGPAALDGLTSAVADECENPPQRKSDVIFSPKAYHESHLVRTAKLIDQAKDSIDIAMYSFGDQKIFDALRDAADRGVSIRMIYNKTRENRDEGNNTMSAKLERIGVDVRWVNKVMHHKYVIVDGVRNSLLEADEAKMATGSGNWSYGAGTRYDENTVFLQGDPEVALRLQSEFNLLWKWSRPYDKNSNLEYFESTPVKKGMIPDQKGVHVHVTSENFDPYHSSRWGNTFGIVRGKSNVSKEIVKMIQEADESIWVASGHLRSRPISEALIEKHENNPDMDIRVYLDGQEYISEGYHWYQVSELEECLEDAGDSEAQRQDCLDSGFYFGFQVQDAGITLRYKYYAYRWHYTYAKQMHHKYLIFDGKKLVSGSYNLSDNAEHNTMENILVYDAARYPSLVDDFKTNFQKIWKTGHADNRYEKLKQTIDNASYKIPIVFKPMALDHGQIEKLKTKIEDTCPAVESDDYDDDPRRHTDCYLND